MDFANPHFAEPQWLWLAFLGPIGLLVLQRYSAAARRRQLAKLASPELAAELTRSHSRVRRVIKELLLLVALSGIGFALARPQWGEQAEKSHLLDQDTVFVLDCSRSMLATDVSPSRLQRAKLAILDSVQRHGHGRVGLVAFAGQAFLECPLTFDYSAFQDSLLMMDDKTIPIPGTDIGRALDEGFRAMDKSNRQKLLVIVTDGEDLENGGVKTAENLAKLGVVVFTIGVGTPAGAEIRMLNEQNKYELVRDSKGEIVHSKLDEAILREIARVTHGAYFPLGPVGEGLAKVRLAIENLSNNSGTSIRKLGVDRFHLPVAIALALLVMESLIGTRRRLRESGRAMRNSAKPAGERAQAVRGALIGMFCIFLGVLRSTGAAPAAKSDAVEPTTPREFYNTGTEKLTQGKLREAEALLETALASQSTRFQPPALYNLGHVRFGQGVQELKKGPAAKPTAARARAAAGIADDAISAADNALAGSDLQQLIGSYIRGRGARKELKAAAKAIQHALDTYGVALRKWQRASGDFRSTVELSPRDAEARENADIMDRNIAKLVDSLKELEQAAGALGQKKQQLGEKMNQLKGRIPASDMPPGAAGEDDDDEDMPNGPQRGDQEGPSKEGEQMSLSPEQAGWLLESFKLDSERRLPMGQKETSEPKDRPRKTW
jgi:Ca-activated chloride channel family protein